MWGLLTNMVTTRRSTRLQEKQVAASAPASPTPSSAQASPVTRRSRSATKATPPSSTRQRKAAPTKSTGSGTRRGRPRKTAEAESDEGVAAQSDASSEPQENALTVDKNEPSVQKQLFADVHHETSAKDEASEPEVIEQVEEAVEVVETTATTVTEVAEAVAGELTGVEAELEPERKIPKEHVTNEETPVESDEPEEEVEVVKAHEETKPEEEEEEIVMMDSSDGEEEDEEEEMGEKQRTTEVQDGPELQEEDDEDIDIAAFAKLAATGISLSSSATMTQSVTSTASTSSLKLVPDTLDSGASSRTKYLAFEGSKLGLGAKIVAQTASAEEQKVLGQQLSKIDKAKRQRAESTNVSTAGRKWFDMASHDLDADARRDFALLKMRNYLDPKKFYKTSDHTKKMPKHFQFGTVIEGAHEFKSARLTKKERKHNFTEEIMADEGIRSYTKRVFLQVQDKRAGSHGKKKKQKRF